MMDNDDDSAFSFHDEEDHKQTQENSSTDSEANLNSRDEVKEIKKVIDRETKAVGRMRLLIVLAMLAVAGAITTMTYLVLADEQDSDFRAQVSYYLFRRPFDVPDIYVCLIHLFTINLFFSIHSV